MKKLNSYKTSFIQFSHFQSVAVSFPLEHIEQQNMLHMCLCIEPHEHRFHSTDFNAEVQTSIQIHNFAALQFGS